MLFRSVGVGDDVNTVLLDALADSTRAVSTYVRESEDIEAKVSSLYSKISNPVLANLKMKVGDGVTISEFYPQELPDLFHGTQLVVFGRYTGKGHTAITLTGQIGKETKEFVYELNFSDKTEVGKGFVEDLWARRKVGFLLDQIRVQGETKEVVEEGPAGELAAAGIEAVNGAGKMQKVALTMLAAGNEPIDQPVG